jgi:two-component system chemotaxis response regulator CheB
MIRVLVVEDSPTARQLLLHILGFDPAIEVVGCAEDGEQAVAMAASKRPNVITMDLHLPRLSGLDAIRIIMETTPTPIVVVSSNLVTAEVDAGVRALAAGALAAVPRPEGWQGPQHAAGARRLVETVKLMAEVKVVRRWPAAHDQKAPPPAPAPHGRMRVVAIGASTGGPAALQSLLAQLPPTFPAPVLIVQHMAPGFIQGFARWLADATGFPVRVAEQSQLAVPGAAYVAPDDCHLGIDPQGRLVLTACPPERGMRPAISYLFRSVTQFYRADAVGVLLSGMGTDGAAALGAMREAGAVTFVQSRASAAVNGMPGEAVRLGAASWVLDPVEIGRSLGRLGKSSRGWNAGQE